MIQKALKAVALSLSFVGAAVADSFTNNYAAMCVAGFNGASLMADSPMSAQSLRRSAKNVDNYIKAQSTASEIAEYSSLLRVYIGEIDDTFSNSAVSILPRQQAQPIALKILSPYLNKCGELPRFHFVKMQNNTQVYQLQ